MFTMGQALADMLRARVERAGSEQAGWDRFDEFHEIIAAHIARSGPETAEHAMHEHFEPGECQSGVLRPARARASLTQPARPNGGVELRPDRMAGTPPGGG